MSSLAFAKCPPVFSHLRRPATSRRPRSPILCASTRFSELFPPSADTVLTPTKTSLSLVHHVNSFTAQQTPVLVGWLRHYGCTLCKKQAADWKALDSRLSECGPLRMILVGNGSPEQAADFVQELDWKGDIFTDPSRTTYEALGFKKGLSSTFTAPALGKVITSLREGNKQTWSRMPTDAFQQGGAVLVDGAGTVSMFHADTFAGDHVDIDVLYDKVCSVCREAVQN